MSVGRREVLMGLAGSALPLLTGTAACASAVSFNAPFSVPADSTKKASKAKSLPETSPLRELDTGSRYRRDDPTKSIVDPDLSDAYESVIAPLRTYAKSVIKAANRYVASDGHDLNAAAQAAGVMKVWADADALAVVSTEVSYFCRNTALGPTAFGLMQVQGAIDSWTRGAIYGWLDSRSGDTMRFVSGLNGTRSGSNNHRYWAGVTVQATGIVGNRSDYFDWGVDCARIGLNQVTADGALPLELARGQKALSYHVFSIGALVMLCEAAARNGDLSLYSLNGEAMHRLIDFTLSQIDNPEIIAGIVGIEQEKLGSGGADFDPFDVAWLEIYESRFPGRSRWSDRMDKLRPLAITGLGGNLTLLYADKKQSLAAGAEVKRTT